MKNYVTHIVLGNGLSVDLFTPAIFRLRKTEIDDEVCQNKYLIPFAVGKVDPWQEVNYTFEKSDCKVSIKTQKLLTIPFYFIPFVAKDLAEGKRIS